MWLVCFFKRAQPPTTRTALGAALEHSEKAAQIFIMASKENCPTDGQGVHGNSISTTHLFATPS